MRACASQYQFRPHSRTLLPSSSPPPQPLGHELCFHFGEPSWETKDMFFSFRQKSCNDRRVRQRGVYGHVFIPAPFLWGRRKVSLSHTDARLTFCWHCVSRNGCGVDRLLLTPRVRQPCDCVVHVLKPSGVCVRWFWGLAKALTGCVCYRYVAHKRPVTLAEQFSVRTNLNRGPELLKTFTSYEKKCGL